MKINLPLTKEVTKNLKAGDIVELSGIIYTARDAAHKRLIERLDANEPLPFDLKDSIIYYVGPTPENQVPSLDRQVRRQVIEWMLTHRPF